ncbi:arf-GAP with Rho-GAP domain, ANK repeat and PH domain-containing protein 1-like isoform X2 [Hypomesus transpacificus]|uniref:arf-GAP with Rho-GAP domain, ANK repeat and PH domain-containing protein 1-like isoform X2 n=1 Tax=Hypomesus transpacificus TaxID=137520 RepID=UPI001F08202F|nr:arf-GAP with Rho-GAP domain, ANK repeat and PH domain-containing protein 1-like isoform X2 [Hypomesus transpacificus]
MERKVDQLRALQKCFMSMEEPVNMNNSEDADSDLSTHRNRSRSSFDEGSLYISCTRPHSLVDPGKPYSSHSPVIKTGWLDKTPPKGTLIFQKRWVTLDAEFLRYYQNEKEVFSKRFIAVSTIADVLSVGEQKFEVVTKNRTFLFRAENSAVRGEWVAVLKETIQQLCSNGKTRSPSLSDAGGDSRGEKQGYLEMNGSRSKLFIVVSADRVFLYLNSEDRSQGIGITSIDMNMGSVKSTDPRAFSLNTCYKPFSFVAETTQQRDEWVEAMQACIGRSLSSDTVVWSVWVEESNRRCADCGAEDPDWASVNLCVVICKCCAGVHRSLGQSVSKVRSLRMDEKVWTDSLVQVFVQLGNDRSNLFWASNVPPSETIRPSSNNEERQNFIKTKYCQRKYRQYHRLFGCQEDLNKALCKSVQTGDLLETMSLVFCGADVNCSTGDPDVPNPLCIAQNYGRKLLEEFLFHNLNTEFPGVQDVERVIPQVAVPIPHAGILFKIGSTTRAVTERKGKGDFSQRWCTLDKGVFKYFDGEKRAHPCGEIKMSDVQCLVVNPLGKHGYLHTFELYQISGRIHLFGADTPDSVQQWIETIAKAIVPPEAEGMASWSFERVGRLRYTEGPNPHCPRACWVAAGGSTLLVLLHGTDRPESIDLRKLQELCVQPEPGPVVLVDRGRTLRLEGDRRADFPGWANSLQQGAGRGDGPLDQQQLTGTDVPVIVDRCLGFITQYGLKSEGIYRKAGVQSKVTALLSSLCLDARRVQLTEGEHKVDDVANTVKRFLRSVREGVFDGEQASLPWLRTVALSETSRRISQYQTLLASLPPVHQATLGAVINHLYCVQCFAEENKMDAHSLSIVFGPTLFQADGTDKSAGQVVEDLVQHYQAIFDVDAEHVKRQIEMISHIITAKEDRPDEETRTICGIYLEVKEEGSELLVQVSQKTTATDVVSEVLRRRNISSQPEDYWSCFLVNDKDDMERPLHYQEQVLPVCFSLDKDCHLVIKKNDYMKTILTCTDGWVNVTRNGHVQFCEEKGQRAKGSFSKRYCVVTATSLEIYKTPKSNHPEKDCHLQALKVYCGIRKKLQPPSSWGMTVVWTQDQHEMHRWYLCCESDQELTDWLATFFFLQHHGDLWPGTS